MKLEVILTGENIEKAIQGISYDFHIGKDDRYHRLSFPLKNREEIDYVLKSLDSILPKEIQVLNTSIILEQGYLELPYGYRVFFIGPEDTPSVREKDIVLKRGLSFGGYHPTTIMCIELLMKLLSKHNSFEKILDLGTGSGILAIMAKKLKTADVYAVDVDFQSCIEAKYNTTLNGYSDAIKIVCGDEHCIKGKFDLIMANIIFHTLEELIKKLTYMLSPNGYLIISGFLAADTGRFAELLGKKGLSATKEKEGWGAILWQKE